jgi:hypothetical protein
MGMALLLITGVAIAATVINCYPQRGCTGTDGPDKLIGSDEWDDMDARQDNDRLFGYEGGDWMLGDAYEMPDNGATDGNDILRGGPGWDGLYGYGGGDLLVGGARGDYIYAREASVNKGEDVVKGNIGNDFIRARDGVKDTIDCGGGTRDVVFFDKEGIDEVADNCEYQNRYPHFREFSSTAASSTPAQVSAKELEAPRAR